MNNNPVKFNDPTGHMVDNGCETQGCDADEGEEYYDYIYNDVSGDVDKEGNSEKVEKAVNTIVKLELGFVSAPLALFYQAINEESLSTTDLVFASFPLWGLSIRTIGSEGEIAAGIIKNTQRIDSLTGTANYRIPDQLLQDQKLISEVKNVAHLFLTNQIKDMVAFAQREGFTFELWVRQSTKISGPLQTLVDDGTIVLKYLEAIK